MEEKPAEDKRLNFFRDYVVKTLRIKADRWDQCLSNEDNMGVLRAFLDQAAQRTLVVCVVPGGQLQLAADVTDATGKQKAVFFMKRSSGAILQEAVREQLVFGDLCCSPLDQFSSLVEEVKLRAGQEVSLLGWDASIPVG